MNVGMRYLKANHGYADPKARYFSFNGLGYSLGEADQPRKMLRFQIKNVIHFLFGYDEGMTSLKWTYVQKSEKVFILRHLKAGNFAVDNPGKYGGHN